MKKKQKVLLSVIILLIVILSAITMICLHYFIGIPKCVGEQAYDYEIQELYVEHDEIRLYGKVLIPQGDGPFPAIIFAHGAEADYKADMTTLKSLAMSGIVCYTFDFYGWTDRSTGPQGIKWFKDVPRGVDDAYERQVLRQVQDLNAVISRISSLDFVDAGKMYLLGSSMGGATAATAAVTHSEDIQGIILQYPAINLNPEAMVEGASLDANRYTGPVLILQGTEDTIVPRSMSEELASYYNELYPEHAELVIYDGQPHVFTGSYKVKAAEDIYRFILENGGIT